MIFFHSIIVFIYYLSYNNSNFLKENKMVPCMKNKLLLLILLVLTTNAQDLKTTLNELISTNPTILERLHNYEATKQDVDSAFSEYYPKLDLTLGVGFEDTDKREQKLAVQNGSADFNVYQNSLKFTQNIFSGFSTKYKVEGQEYRSVSAAYSYVETVNNTSFNLVNSYIELMKNRDLLDTAAQNVNIDKEILSKVQKLYKSGLTTLSEVNKVESSLALANSNYVVQENSLLDASYNLQRILGRELDLKLLEKPTIHVLMPKTKEEALLYALHNNPSLLVSQYNLLLAKSTQYEKESPFYPKIDIEVSQTLNKNLSAVAGKEDRFRAMAYLTYNIFNGFADDANLQKSKSAVFQEVETQNSIKRQIVSGLNLAWAAKTKLAEQLKYLKEYKEFSYKTLTLYSKEYDLGRRSLLDLLSAQNDYIKAKAQIISTEYSLLYAEYRILDAMGVLVPSVIGENKLVYSAVDLKIESPKAHK